MPTILVVDDAPADLNALRLGAEDAIEALGGRVEIASDVERAISLIQQQYFDVVVTDLQLTPEKHNEGWDVLQYARKINAKTQVIVVTGFPQPEIEAKSMSLGAFDYIDKLEGDMIEQIKDVVGKALKARDKQVT